MRRAPIMPRMASSDPACKLLFSQPRMVEDTLRGYVAPHWYEALDFPTLAQMNAEYIGPELYNRIGDMLWRVEFREGSPFTERHVQSPVQLVLDSPVRTRRSSK